MFTDLHHHRRQLIGLRHRGCLAGWLADVAITNNFCSTAIAAASVANIPPMHFDSWTLGGFNLLAAATFSQPFKQASDHLNSTTNCYIIRSKISYVSHSLTHSPACRVQWKDNNYAVR